MKFTLYILLIITIISCTKHNAAFKTTGKIIKEHRLLSDFNEIELNNIFNVYITNDTINKITLEGGTNLLPFIKTEVNNNTLTIKDNNKCNWLRSYKKETNLYISAKSLSSLIINGECNVYSTDTIKCNEFSVVVFSGIAKVDLTVNNAITHLTVHAGTGDYTLRGKTNYAYLYSFGTCYFWAKELNADNIYVTNKSTGNDYIFANNEIRGEINGSGNIYYSGNPQTVDIKQTSTGRVIKQ